MKLFSLSSIFACFIASIVLAQQVHSAYHRHPSASVQSPGVPYFRSYFYAGGEYADDGTDTGKHIYRDQLYVEHLVPSDGVKQKFPLVLIHGQAQTGTNFLNKPDGGEGWASLFLRQGYEVFIVDQPLRGRSAWQPSVNARTPSNYSAELIQQRFTAVQDYTLWPQAVLHTQWNGSGRMGDAIFDAFYGSNVQFINNATYQQSTMQAAGAALLDMIGQPTVLIGHSQGGLMPFLIADIRPELTKALVEIEPTGPPFVEAVFSNASTRQYGLADIPLTYEPAVNLPGDLVKQVYPAPDANHTSCTLQAQDPAPRHLTNLSKMPILLVTAEASYHAPYDYCTVDYLKQAGCIQTEHLVLAEKGVHGNGHMMFMEKNSDDIQRLIAQWLAALE